MRFISRVLIFSIVSTLSFGSAWAQFAIQAGVGGGMPWGMGGYGASGMCPYGQGIASGAVSELEELEELNDEMDRLKELLRDYRKKKRETERKMSKDRAAITSNFTDPGVAQDVISHIETPLTCDQHKPPQRKAEKASGGENNKDSGGSANFSADSEDESSSTASSSSGLSYNDWAKYCDWTAAGKIRPSLCIDRARVDKAQCRIAMEDLGYQRTQKDGIDAEIRNLEAQIESIKDQKKQVESDAKRSIKEARREGGLEGGCIGCYLNGGMRSQKTSGWNILGGLAAGAIGAGLGYLGAENAMETNAKLGFPTNPSAGFGWPMGMMLGSMALYGALSGGTNGGFGCNGGMGGPFGPGGVMGYPGGMYPGFPGGGPFMNPFGMGGMGNPFGMGGMGNPFGMGGMGNPFGMGGMGNPFGMGGMGNPFGMGGMGNPFGMGGMGNPFGMGGMGNPFGMGGMGNPFGMGGMGGINPYGMGGNPFGGMMNPYGMDNGMMQMQMQMQMQQYQFMMDQQRRMQDAAMAKQRTMTGLYQELQSLMYRINQVQMGVGLGVDVNLPIYSPQPQPYGGPGGQYPGSYMPNNNGGFINNGQQGTPGTGVYSR